MIVQHKTLYNVVSIERIPPGEGRTYHVNETEVAIFRTSSGGVYATQAACPHKRGPLADGFVGPSAVICPLHSFKFNLADGQPVENTCHELKVYTIQVKDNGDMLLAL